MTAELKPMSLSEILDRTFTLYRNNFWLFCGLMAMPEAAIALISIVYLTLMGGQMGIAMQPNPQDPLAALAGMRAIVPGILITTILNAFFFSIALGAVTLAVSEIYLGRRGSIVEAYKGVARRMPGIFGLILLLLLLLFVFMFVGVVAGMVPAIAIAGVLGAIAGSAGAPGIAVTLLIGLLIIVFVIGGFVLGIWLMMRFAVSIPAFMLERLGVLNALGRSGLLTKGHRWRIFVSTLVMYVVVFGVRLLFEMPFIPFTMMHAREGVLPLWLRMGTSVAGAVAGTVAGPLLMITIALIYYDVRIRKEAFDLEAMMAALGSTGPQQGQVGAAPPLNPGG
jgi:hypothetical protein